MFCANLARDPTDPIAVQPESSGVLAIFMFVGVFIVSNIRQRIPRGWK